MKNQISAQDAPANLKYTTMDDLYNRYGGRIYTDPIGDIISLHLSSIESFCSILDGELRVVCAGEVFSVLEPLVEKARKEIFEALDFAEESTGEIILLRAMRDNPDYPLNNLLEAYLRFKGDKRYYYFG